MDSNINKIMVNLKIERKRLLDEQELLRASCIPSDGRREGVPYFKWGEKATESSELKRRSALCKRLEVQLEYIEDTLSKIPAGKYGLCESCGKPIEMLRLQVLPQARLCVSCKVYHKRHFHNIIQLI